jgi:uncharacterized protein YegP (UPF0339 family)
MAGKYELFKSSGHFYFRLKAGNGEIILQSQAYTEKSGAENGIASVAHHSPDDQYYDRKTSTSGNPYFNLKAANSQVIGTSEMYSSTSARETGISSVKANGPVAPTIDLT